MAVERCKHKGGSVQVLVRNPVAVVTSFAEVLEPTLEETCFPALCSIVSELRSIGCAHPGSATKEHEWMCSRSRKPSGS